MEWDLAEEVSGFQQRKGNITRKGERSQIPVYRALVDTVQDHKYLLCRVLRGHMRQECPSYFHGFCALMMVVKGNYRHAI